jgi:sugar transferase (PEP-CTERM system associated)
LIRLLNAHFPARTLFLGISEACLVTAAFLIATIVRLGDSDAGLMLRYEQGFLKIVVVSGVVMACMYYFDLYDSAILSNRREVLTRIVQVLGTVCVLLAMLYYVYPPLELGRGIFLIGFTFLTALLFLWRRLFLTLNVLPRFAERTLIFGDGPLAEPLVRELSSRPELGLAVVGHVSKAAHQDASQNRAQSLIETVGLEDEICHAVKSLRANRIIIAMGDRRGTLPVELLLSLKGGGVQIQDGTDVYEAITGKVPVESLRLGWLLFSPGFHISRFLQVYKRCASLVVSTTGLLLSLPLIPFVALAVKLTSPGPLLYRQNRVGRAGNVFECYKFRTMRADAEADSGPTWAGDDDPRITRVGRFLRRTRIDEIPQLWNVLRGDMTLVGPRPERPEFVADLAKVIPHYNLRHTIRPGITGWAQIRYKYGSSIEDAKEKLRYDLFYVKNISPGLDLLILLQTIKTILWRRGAQ